MSEVKFYKPVKCNLIKTAKCLLNWLLVQQHSDFRMMEDTINNIFNEPTPCLWNKRFSSAVSLTLTNGGKWRLVIAQTQPAVRSSQAWLIILQFLHARSFTLAALETVRSLRFLEKCCFIITLYRLLKCGTGQLIQSKAVDIGMVCRSLKRYLGDLEKVSHL